MRSNRFRLFSIFLVAASLMLAVACSKINAENYAQLSSGMEYDEVVALLGEPEECSGGFGVKSCTWGDETKQININFAGSTMVTFSGKGL